MAYAVSSGGDVWKEFFQYFRGSKFVSISVLYFAMHFMFEYKVSYLNLDSCFQIHIMSIDFTLLSTFAPFWVYNDMTARKW